MKKGIVLLWCIAIGTGSSFGQIIKRTVSHKDEMPPSFLLVQLITGSNKIKYYERHGEPEKAAQIRRDAAAINKNIIRDFNRHFSFCPVYYFYDTNVVNIVRQQFDGAILDTSLQHIVLQVQPGDTSYFIGQYGRNDRSKRTNSYTLLARNWHAELLEEPLPLAPFLRFRPRSKVYYYRSELLDLTYYAVANAYSQTLALFYRNK